MTVERKYDVVIAGGGPAGASCATRLVRAGVKVLVLEKKQFPRPKLCGEFISPECFEHFKELGVADQMELSGGTLVERTVFYARGGRSVTVPSSWFGAGTGALGLSRARMDEVLLEAAEAAGADVIQNALVAGVLSETCGTVKGVRVRTEGRQEINVGCNLLVDATGRERAITRLISPHQKKRRARYVAFKAHLSRANIPRGDCEIYSYGGGYGGCSEVEDDLYNLCFIIDAPTAKRFGGDAEQIMRSVVCSNAKAADSLGPAEVVSDWLAVPIENYGRARPSSATGIIAIGDAAAFIDPFTGSGILLALESSRLAAGAFLDSKGSFERFVRYYTTRYQAAFDRRLSISSLVRRAAFMPLLANTVVHGLSFSKGATRLLARTTRYSGEKALRSK